MRQVRCIYAPSQLMHPNSDFWKYKLARMGQYDSSCVAALIV